MRWKPLECSQNATVVWSNWCRKLLNIYILYVLWYCNAVGEHTLLSKYLPKSHEKCFSERWRSCDRKWFAVYTKHLSDALNFRSSLCWPNEFKSTHLFNRKGCTLSLTATLRKKQSPNSQLISVYMPDDLLTAAAMLKTRVFRDMTLRFVSFHHFLLRVPVLINTNPIKILVPYLRTSWIRHFHLRLGFPNGPSPYVTHTKRLNALTSLLFVQYIPPMSSDFIAPIRICWRAAQWSS